MLDDLKVAFKTFLAEGEENWLKPLDKEPTSLLGRAYFNFWMEFSNLEN